jgi:RNA polymerase sigma factor (TIGR02999 family)
MKLGTTNLLRQPGSGNRAVVDRLFSVLYDDLRAQAEVIFRREAPHATLEPAALVNEAYLRLLDQRRIKCKSRAHFCCLAALTMRRIVVDEARRRGAAKRRAPLEEPDACALTLPETDPETMLLIKELLEHLEHESPRQAEIVELRFVGGLTVEEVAEVLGMTKRAVEAEWTSIRTNLRTQLTEPCNAARHPEH